MEPSTERFEFLDLTDVPEHEQCLIERVLFTASQTFKVPWQTDRVTVELSPNATAWVQPYALVSLPGSVIISPGSYHWISSAGCDQQQTTQHSVNNSNGHIEQHQQHSQHNEEITQHHHQHNVEIITTRPQQQQQQQTLFTPPQQPLFQMYPMVAPPSVYVPNQYVQHYSNQHPPAQQQPPPPPTHVYTQQQQQQHDNESNNRMRRQIRSKNEKKQQQQQYEVMSPPMDNHAPPYQLIQPLPPPYYLSSGPVYMQPSSAIYQPLFAPYNHSPNTIVYQTNSLPPNNDNYHDSGYDNSPGDMMRHDNDDYSITEGYRECGSVHEQSYNDQSEQLTYDNSNNNNSSILTEHMCYHTEVVVKLPKKKVKSDESGVKDKEVMMTTTTTPQPAASNVEDVEVPTVCETSDSDNNFPAATTDIDQVVVVSSCGSPTPIQQQQQREKTWASLFNSSSANTASPMSGRPLARVSPFQDVTNSYDDAGKKNNVADNMGVVANSFSSAGKGMDDSRLINLGIFLTKYELDHKAINLQPRGLTNRNNWCYINSILQALIACPPFYNLMKSIGLPHGLPGSSRTPIINSMVEFVNEFQTLPPNARIGKREKSARNKDDNGFVEIVPGAAFEPSGVYKILDKVRGDNSFNVEGRQEDAEEFLSCLLNGLNDEMIEVMKLVEKKSSNNGHLTNGVSRDVDMDDEQESEWSCMGPKNKGSVTRRGEYCKTPVSDIFRGQLRSRLQRAGDQTTDSIQPFFTLQLDIEKANSVKDALEVLVGKDQLEGLTCSKTNQEVEAWTQITLEDLPNVLILHLKCFDYKLNGCSKIMKNVEFTIDLKVDPKLMPVSKNKYIGKQKQYKLFAVVYHDGKEATKGHYVTDAYHPGYGCWLRYDDGVVKFIPESHMLKPKGPRVPYLLYYRRGDTIGTTVTNTR